MIFSSRNAAANRRRDRRASRVGSEDLEGRRLMTVAIPSTGNTVTIPAADNWTRYQIPASSESAMETTTVTGTMVSAGPNLNMYGDNFEVYLEAGQVDDISLDVRNGTLSPAALDSSISVYALNNNTQQIGAQLAGMSRSAGDSETAFQAPGTGWYYVSVHSDESGWAQDQYTAEIRPIGLYAPTEASLDPDAQTAQGRADRARLDFDGGGLYAFVGGRAMTVDNGSYAVGDSGTSLTFAGPTGLGFTIDGTWNVGEDASTGTVTYTGTDLTLVAANPADPTSTINVPLSADGVGPTLTVTAYQGATNDAYGLYGQVTNAQFGEDGLNSGASGVQQGLIASIASAFDLDANLDGAGLSASMPDVTWGIDLGQAATDATNFLPTNPAVPYFYINYAGGDGAGLTYGKVTASVGQSGGFSAVVDPADPSFELDVTTPSAIPDVAVGASIDGLLPYLPSASAMSGQGFYGDVFVRGSLSLASIDPEVPIDLAGDVTLNLNAGQGGIAGVPTALNDDAEGWFAAKSATSFAGMLASDADRIDIGVNGTMSLDLSIKAINLTMPIGTASAEWDGPARQVTFAGNSIDPLEGTALAPLTRGKGLNFDVYGQVDAADGTFFADVEGSFGCNIGSISGGVDVSLDADHVLTIELNGGISLGGSASVDGFGGTGEVSGTVDLGINSEGVTWGSISGSIDVAAEFCGYTWTILDDSYYLALPTSDFADLFDDLGDDFKADVVDRVKTAVEEYFGV